jgi:prepilin-type N-terminal cleavage/methylation domain-containing protein
MKYFRGRRSGERGFTLVELLVVIPITAVVVAAAAGGLIQLVNSKDASTHMYSLRQVQTAGYWVSTDAYQAQQVGTIVGETTVGPNQGFPLVLTRLDPDTNESHLVTYDLVGSTGGPLTLERTEVITNQATGDQTTLQTTVARYLVDSIEGAPATMIRVGDVNIGEPPLIFTVSSQVGREPLEERTYNITLRPEALSQVGF